MKPFEKKWKMCSLKFLRITQKADYHCQNVFQSCPEISKNFQFSFSFELSFQSKLRSKLRNEKPELDFWPKLHFIWTWKFSKRLNQITVKLGWTHRVWSTVSLGALPFTSLFQILLQRFRFHVHITRTLSQKCRLWFRISKIRACLFHSRFGSNENENVFGNPTFNTIRNREEMSWWLDMS